MSKKSLLEKIEVKEPCSENWDEMRGGDEARFCSHCSKSVNNLSAMTRKKALKIVRESNGNICVRYIKNPVSNAPVFANELYQIARRAPSLAVGVMTAALSLSAMTYAQGGILPVKDSTGQTEESREKDSRKDKVESTAGTLTGTVKDATGAVIPNIVITLTNETNTVNLIMRSNGEGEYRFENLETGIYTLEAEGVNGFATTKLRNVAVQTERDTYCDIEMGVAGQQIFMGDVVSIEYELPLLQAVSEENQDEIISLLAKGANVNGKDKNYDGITAIFVAVEQGNVETVRTLLEFGAKVNVRDAEKRTPLMRLDDDATPELVSLLLSHGAKIKAVDKEGNTVLHHAAYYAKREVLEILINESAKINEQNEDGETPLMIAVRYENLESVKALLDAGADANLRDEEERTALGIAFENDYKEIAELLNSFGGKE